MVAKTLQRNDLRSALSIRLEVLDELLLRRTFASGSVLGVSYSSSEVSNAWHVLESVLGLGDIVMLYLKIVTLVLHERELTDLFPLQKVIRTVLALQRFVMSVWFDEIRRLLSPLLAVWLSLRNIKLWLGHLCSRNWSLHGEILASWLPDVGPSTHCCIQTMLVTWF